MLHMHREGDAFSPAPPPPSRTCRRLTCSGALLVAEEEEEGAPAVRSSPCRLPLSSTMSTPLAQPCLLHSSCRCAVSSENGGMEPSGRGRATTISALAALHSGQRLSL